MQDARLYSHNSETQKEYIREKLRMVGVIKDYRLSINSTEGIIIKLNSLKVDVNQVIKVVNLINSEGRVAKVEYTDKVLEEFTARYGYIAKHLYTNTKNRKTSGRVAKNPHYTIMFEPNVDGNPYYTLERANGGGRVSQLNLDKTTQFTEANLAAWICKAVLYNGHYQLLPGLEFDAPTEPKKPQHLSFKHAAPPLYATDKKANVEMWDRLETIIDTALGAIVFTLDKHRGFEVDTEMTKEAVMRVVELFEEYGVTIPYVDEDM